MSAFGKYFGRLFKVLWEDIIDFFSDIIDFFVAIFRSIISNFSYYKSVFDLYAQDFDAIGWIFFVLSIILVIGLIAGVIFLFVKVTKYWLHEIIRPTLVVKHASVNNTASKTAPDLPNKYFRPAIINMLKEVKGYMVKMGKQIRNLEKWKL